MKKWFDNIFIRIGFVIIILSIFFIIIFQRFKVFTFDKKWYEEDKLINRMNVEKLQNKWWKSYPLWIHEGETLEAKKEGVKRILIIGDSYVWGWGYSNANHLWWKQFSLLLKQEGYNNVEVVVAGISGYNTKQEFEYIIKNKELINQVNPDCIVLCYVSNDVEIKDEDGNFFIKYNEDRDMFKNSNNKFINFFKENFNSLYNIFNTLMFKKIWSKREF